MEIDGGLEAKNGDSGDFDATLLHAIAESWDLSLGLEERGLMWMLRECTFELAL